MSALISPASRINEQFFIVLLYVTLWLSGKLHYPLLRTHHDVTQNDEKWLKMQEKDSKYRKVTQSYQSVEGRSCLKIGHWAHFGCHIVLANACPDERTRSASAIMSKREKANIIRVKDRRYETHFGSLLNLDIC